jgi:hypothetical protein
VTQEAVSSTDEPPTVDADARATSQPGGLKNWSTAILIAQPMVFGVAILLARAVEVSTTPASLLRPLVAVTLFAALVLFGGRIATRSWALAAIIASAIVLFTLREILPAFVLGLFALWWLVISGLRRAQSRRLPPARVPRAVARAAGIFAVVSLVFWAFQAWSAMTVEPPAVSIPEASARAAGVGSGEADPDIYVLLLDGYPRNDTLEATFDYDNSSFEGELESLGFDVAHEARSNYNRTWLTLASALNGQYVDDMMAGAPYPPDSDGQLRILQKLIDRASMLDVLRDRGYRILTAPPPFASATLTSADDFMGHQHLTQFEVRLIESSPWTLMFRDQVAGLLAESQHGSVVDAVDHAVAAARASGATPTFALSHIHSPHVPFVLGTPGSAALPACFPIDCTIWNATIEELGIDLEEYREGLVGELGEINALILDAVQEIVESDPSAVVILMSDHGSRYSLTDAGEMYRSFLAARTPGHDGLMSDGPSPVNLLRRLFSAYLPVDFAELPYEAWQSDWSQYLWLVPYERDE